MPGPWRRRQRKREGNSHASFNLNRDARPLATQALRYCEGHDDLFQSQPRCQAPGDGFFLCLLPLFFCVSISTEMPGPWRPVSPGIAYTKFISFNLNRDARPLATRSVSVSWYPSFVVSISTEMPGPWRHKQWQRTIRRIDWFQSQPRCQAPGDFIICTHERNYTMFQSQPRCQAPGDLRLISPSWIRSRFQSQPRCQAPGDRQKYCGARRYWKFQSQPRCQAPGDFERVTHAPWV